MKRLFCVFVTAVLLVALLLTSLVLLRNPGALEVGSTLELGLAMTWIALVTNGVFTLCLALLWFPLSGLRRSFFGHSASAFLLGGLVACNVVWCLWNRLAMANSFSGSKSLFFTTTSFIELFCLLLLGAGILIAFVGFARGRAEAAGSARRSAVLGVILALAGTAIALGLSAREEGMRRLVTHEQIVAASAKALGSDAGSDPEQTDEGSSSALGNDAPPDTSASGRRVITIGADGLDWSVIVPLMKKGSLPNLARFIDQGATGYLDNGNESYSPIIWTTMFTGLPGRIHGVFDFQKAVLTRSGYGISNPLLMSPTIDSFYGLKMLLGNSLLQAPGLWDMAWVGAQDRRVPTVWDVASAYDKQVAVCDALANIPARPVNGAIINLGREKGGGSGAYFPPELRDLWHARRMPDPEFDLGAEDLGAQRFNALSTRFQGEVGFALEVLDQFGKDFCFYYTYFVDSQCHSEWNFFAPDSLFLGELPRDLNDLEWEEFLEEHADARAIKAYSVLDEQLGRFRERFPEALFVIVSDHGWTFSGYEHFTSPDGIVIFSGPGVKAGLELEGVHIRDIAPTLLALLGAPVSAQLPGRVVGEAFDFDLTPELIPNYLDVDMSFPTGARMEVSAEEEQRLRDIGYVR